MYKHYTHTIERWKSKFLNRFFSYWKIQKHTQKSSKKSHHHRVSVMMCSRKKIKAPSKIYIHRISRKSSTNTDTKLRSKMGFGLKSFLSLTHTHSCVCTKISAAMCWGILRCLHKFISICVCVSVSAVAEKESFFVEINFWKLYFSSFYSLIKL